MTSRIASTPRPIVVIGAPRSGTNMLRDVLTSFPDIATWPCDEINYLWRHRNLRHPSDEFTQPMARPEVCRYMRKQFAWVERRYDVPTVVEKTCANSLRVPFVDAVLPEARYLFIRRDGLDVVESAMKRWQAPLDIPYLGRKARFVPLTDLPYYGGRYLWHRLYRLVSRNGRLATWGPVLDDMTAILKHHPLDEVCALQWQRCVDKARDALVGIDSDRWLEIGYEEFVRDPERELQRVMAFLGGEVPGETARFATADIRADSVGKGRAELDAEATRRIESLVGRTLERFGYA